MFKKTDIIWYMLPVAAIVIFVAWLLYTPARDYAPPAARASRAPAVSPAATVGANGSVTLDAQNVQSVLATLSRPATYTRDYTVTLYWGRGDAEQNAQSVTVERNDGVYFVGGAELYDDVSADVAARLPSYEDILALEANDILSADYVYVDAAPYVAVRFNGTLYEHEYYISVNSGLLERAFKYKGDRLVYAMVME